MEPEQQIQEKQYGFPYHHLVQLDPFSQSRELRWGYEYAAYVKEVLRALQKIEFSSLLDVGCGDGKFLHEAQKQFADKTLEGVDYSERSIAFAKAFSPNLRFYVADITEGGAAPGPYDVATLIETLEHIPPEEIDRFLQAIRRRLSPNGVLILTVPSANSPVSKKHYQHFSLGSLGQTLSPHFAIESHIFLNKASFVKHVVQFLLTNRLWNMRPQRLRRALYRWYERKSGRASAYNGGRIFAVCRK